MVGECVEFEANFSLWLVFQGDVVGSVGRQSFEGENGLDFQSILGEFTDGEISGLKGQIRY